MSQSTPPAPGTTPNASNVSSALPDTTDVESASVTPQSPSSSMSRPSISQSQNSQASSSPATSLPHNPVPSASNPTPTRAAPLLQPQSSTPQLSRAAKIKSRLWRLKELLYALVVIALVDGLALSSPSTKSPLGSINYTSSVLVLSVLALLTTYSLTAAAQVAWTAAQFGRLSKRHHSGENLLVFWTMSMGVSGSFTILWREVKNLFIKRGPTITHTSPRGRSNTHTKGRGHPKFWSTFRIASWIVIQFPGVIIMSIVNSTTSYIPTQRKSISGGIGIYDPKAAIAGAYPILITNSVLNILQDTSKAVQVHPVDSDCIKAGRACKSFLIPGGLSTVSPWPYQKLNDTSLEVFVTKGAPAYQLDFWAPEGDVMLAQDACNVYAASEDLGFQLCMAPHPEGIGQMIAGWTPCTVAILSSGECNQTGSWGAHKFTSTRLSISRRNVTVYAMRDTSTIVRWSELGKPELQNITASDLKTAIDVMILPWYSPTSLSGDSIFQLTAQIATTLVLDLAAPEDTKSLDYLQNLLATPLYIFNPLVLGTDAMVPAITNVQPGLLPENYVDGSYARVRTHAVPERWTVLAFVGVSGFLLLAICTATALGISRNGASVSMFPFAALPNLKWVILDEPGKQVQNIGEVFSKEVLVDDGSILRRASRVMVKLRNAIEATDGHV